jgi:serine O-acetyltransferase
MNDNERIENLAEAWSWLTQDLRYRGVVSFQDKIRLRDLLLDPINHFMFLLRMNEWARNSNAPWPIKIIIRILFRRQSIRLGFSIPPNVFGPGLAIVHYGNIVVNSAARIGKNCRIHVGVNIGGKAGFTSVQDAQSLSPKIGANAYIGPGAKLFGPIEIGDKIVIGANSVVRESFSEGSVTLAGIPAKIISHKSSEDLIMNPNIEFRIKKDSA